MVLYCLLLLLTLGEWKNAHKLTYLYRTMSIGWRQIAKCCTGFLNIWPCSNTSLSVCLLVTGSINCNNWVVVQTCNIFIRPIVQLWIMVSRVIAIAHMHTNKMNTFVSNGLFFFIGMREKNAISWFVSKRKWNVFYDLWSWWIGNRIKWNRMQLDWSSSETIHFLVGIHWIIYRLKKIVNGMLLEWIWDKGLCHCRLSIEWWIQGSQNVQAFR